MKKISIYILLFFFALNAKSQESIFSNMSLNGYVKYMNSSTISNVDSVWLVDNLIHNRLNYKWYMNDKFTLVLEARNRLIYGDMVQFIPNYADMIEDDQGLLCFKFHS